METPARRGRKPAHSDPVALRALALLAAFDDGHRALGLADLARRCATPRSTALRLARQLVEWGALERDAEGRYVIGLRLFEIASLAPRTHGLREVALPFLSDLHEMTGQHVLLAVPDGAQALLLERLSAPGAVALDYRVGGRMPLHDTGVGVVLLAGADATHRARVLDGLEPAAGQRLLRRVSDAQRRGVVVFRRARPTRVASVAAPVTDRSGRTIAAVSVVLPDRDARPQDYQHVVRATGLTVSAALSRSG